MSLQRSHERFHAAKSSKCYAHAVITTGNRRVEQLAGALYNRRCCNERVHSCHAGANNAVIHSCRDSHITARNCCKCAQQRDDAVS